MPDPKKSKSRSTTREAILRAASQVIVDKGIDALTLGAVAHAAGVSKGGLLYHFPNKEALVAGMINYLIDEFEAVLQQEFDHDDALGTPGQWIRAYVRASIRFNRQTLALLMNLASAVTTNPAFMEPAQAYEKRWQERLEASGIDPIRATIIQLACDGLWFAESFEIGQPSEPLRTQVIEALLAMTRERD